MSSPRGLRLPHEPNGRLDRFAIVPWIAGVAVIAVMWVRVVRKPGDFKDHWRFGARLLDHEFLYDGGFHGVYPPLWAFVHAPLSLIPIPVASALVFPVGLAMVVLLYLALDRLTRTFLPLARDQRFWTVVLVVLLAGRFVAGDLAASSYNTIMVSLAWLSILAWTRRREVLGGALLGLAIALKCTMAVLVPYFLWKRQWKMAITTAVATAVFFLVPVVWMGPTEYTQTMRRWTGLVVGGFAGADASESVVGEETIDNNSLKSALVRYLVRLPEGHEGRVDHPLYLDMLDLSPAVAGWVIKGIMITLLGFVAWRLRGAVTRRDDPVIIAECAIVTLMAPLLSPVTWTGHCVAAIPALYFIVRKALHDEWIDRSALVLLAAYFLLVNGLNRAVVGVRLTEVLDSYHVQTWGLVIVLGIALAMQRNVETSGGKVETSKRRNVGI